MASRPVIRVLSVASECVPLVKTGGLADVAGALPGALAPHGVDMHTLVPGYRQVMAKLNGDLPAIDLGGVMGGPAKLKRATIDGLTLFVLDAPHLFDRAGSIYLDEEGKDWPDNPERFAALCSVAADIAGGLIDDWRPDVVHSHDWQGGLANYYLTSRSIDVPSVITIHNIAFQGLAPLYRAGGLGIAVEDLRSNRVEFWGQVSALKAGMLEADRITTVSPTYARELMTPEFGMGLDGFLREQGHKLSGILNGVDVSVWSPELDAHISTYKTPRGKARNKAALRDAFGLPQSDGPLCVVVSRLSAQKGFDMLLEALPALLARGGQLALLGSGDKELEAAFKALNDSNVAVHIGYDDALSHRMIAGGDAIIVPSRFEPCGLTQLYGLRYGTIPVVALTGGLADTVIPTTPAAMAKKVATGLQFYPVTSAALAAAFAQLCDLYEQPSVWSSLQRNAMSHPVGWESSAAAYAALYAGLVESKVT